ncbi:MAG: 30S ribosomal protein S4 [Chloroflexota bacterium]|nr:30S ribosomal protein S4 [Chloroflexota bacterium]
MASYHAPKARVMRRFGEVLVPRPKYHKIVEKRGYPPGEHGKEKAFRSGRRSDYGTQLSEKQKLSFIYNIRETQLRRYFNRARRMPGNTGSNLLMLLERRLDNMVYRAGFAATIWAARQMVSHGHILVDGQRLDLASYQVNPGQTIAVIPKMQKNVHVIESMESSIHNLPYLSVDKTNFSARLSHVPERADIPVPLQEQLVVEFYNRLV